MIGSLSWAGINTVSLIISQLSRRATIIKRILRKNDESQVAGGSIKYHPCDIQPTNRDLISNNFNIGQALSDLKFDASSSYLSSKQLK